VFDDGNLKYSSHIEINKPIDLVDVLFEDIYNMQKYMPGTQEVTLISGKDKESGAKYKIIVTAGTESMEMIGTLKNNHLPDSLTMTYEMPGVLNIMTQKHQKISETKTLIINQQEFQFSGFMKILAFFQPSGFNIDAFKQQSNIYLNSFKAFVENIENN
tara:strand:+ start:487 stop:963 length:477 start_codon:yes stop_codon:yes gene_type:complete